MKQLSDITQSIAECQQKAEAVISAKHFYSDGIRERMDSLSKKLQKAEYIAGYDCFFFYLTMIIDLYSLSIFTLSC